ncbi:MAG: hypothetical protein WDW38_001322 [Sanguina aurantia]
MCREEFTMADLRTNYVALGPAPAACPPPPPSASEASAPRGRIATREASINAVTADMAASRLLVQQCETAQASAETAVDDLQSELAGRVEEADSAEAAATEALQAAAQAAATARAAQQAAADTRTAADVAQRGVVEVRGRKQAAQSRASAARGSLATATEGLRGLTARLQPLKRSLDAAENGAGGSTAEAGSSSSSSSGSKRGETDEPPAPAPAPVVLVGSKRVREVVALMQLSSIPTVYDLEGQTLSFPEGEGLRLHGRATLRNGRVDLGPAGMLQSHGSDVVLEFITVVGKLVGVVVMGGSLTMTACEVRGCNTGVEVMGGSVFTASGLYLLDCGDVGIRLSGSSKASISTGTITGTGTAGISMCQHSSMAGAQMHITARENSAADVRHHANLALTGCTLVGQQPGERLVRVCDDGSVVITGCALNGTVSKLHRATVQITE